MHGNQRITSPLWTVSFAAFLFVRIDCVTSFKVGSGHTYSAVVAINIALTLNPNADRKHSCQPILQLGWHNHREAKVDGSPTRRNSRRWYARANLAQFHLQRICIYCWCAHTLTVFWLIIPNTQPLRFVAKYVSPTYLPTGSPLRSPRSPKSPRGSKGKNYERDLKIYYDTCVYISYCVSKINKMFDVALSDHGRLISAMQQQQQENSRFGTRVVWPCRSGTSNTTFHFSVSLYSRCVLTPPTVFRAYYPSFQWPPASCRFMTVHRLPCCPNKSRCLPPMHHCYAISRRPIICAGQ